jgi:hypothetical protein
VSSARSLSTFVARVALALSVLLGFNAGTVTTGAGSADQNDIVNAAAVDPTSGGVVTQAAVSGTSTYQESSARIVYRGRWSSTSYSGYLGRHAKWSKQGGASATFRFTGTRISWIGPIGPTRGKARIYVNGRYVKTVSTFSSRFVARHVIYSVSYAVARERTIKIVVAGTAGHPTVAIDAFVVRTGVVASAPTPSAPGNVVNVASIAALKKALADNSVDEIVVADGTYHVSASSAIRPDSLWIGSAQAGDYDFAARTRPVTVRAATRGGVVLDGGGGSGYGGLSFEDGAHDQTWDGFTFANMTGTSSGIIEFGGNTPRRPPHHITLRNITIRNTCHRASSSSNQEQGIYFAHAAGTGPHDLLLEDITIDGTDPLSVWSGIHAFHGDALNPPSSNVTIRRLHVRGTTYPIILWTTAAHDWLIEGADISGAASNAVRYEISGGLRNTIKDVVSTGSGQGGFYSSLGPNPAGLTLTNDSFH